MKARAIAWKNKTLDFVYRMDSLIERQLDQYLPESLTRRYVIGFVAIAVLAIIGQALTQVSSRIQQHAYQRIRAVEDQVSNTLDFSRQLVRLKLATHQPVLVAGVENAERQWGELKQQLLKVSEEQSFAETMLTDGSSLGAYLAIARNLERQGNESLASLRDHVFDRKNYKSEFLVAGVTYTDRMDRMLANALSYRTALEELGNFYEAQLAHKMRRFRDIELVLLFTTLLALLFEGLYVFRPAVNRLYEALDAKTKFLSSMGHEIRNPMNSILGMITLLEQTRLDDQQRRYTSILSSSSNSLLSLLNNLVDYTKISSGKIVLEYYDFDLIRFLQSSVELFTYKVDEKKLDLVIELDFDLPQRVTCDRTRVQQVIMNLIGNAIKFTAKGEISFRAWFEPKDEESLLHFSVSDTGIGISADKLLEIFESFSQEDPSILRKYGGSGLGLSISKDLVRLMGGTIDVQSQKGVGSTFLVSIPVKNFSGDRFGDTFREKELSGLNIFLAEKNQKKERKYRSYLEASGARVVLQSELERDIDFKDMKVWGNYLTENQFDKYIVNYEHFSYLIDPLRSAQKNLGENTDLLSRVLVLIRSSTPSSTLVELNSTGVKNFCYLPVKPHEFVQSAKASLRDRRRAPAPALAAPAPVAGPIVPKAPARAEPGITSEDLARPLKVLIVDDAKDNQFLLRAYLEKSTEVMDFADNGLEALEKFKNFRYDLVLMDVLMPEMSGYESVAAMRAWEKEKNLEAVPVVAVTAHSSEEEKRRCREAGYSAHFSKPVSLQEIKSFLSKRFGGKKYSTLDDSLQDKIAAYLPKYFEQRRMDLEKIDASLQSKDLAAVAGIGHKIKGSAATYGFPELGEMGADLEKLALASNESGTREKAESIKRWLHTTREKFPTA